MRRAIFVALVAATVGSTAAIGSPLAPSGAVLDDDVAYAREAAERPFINVEGSQLYAGDEPFRFVSFNVPNLLYVEDELAFDQNNPYRLPTEYELRDAYETVRQMGGNVVRAYTIPVRNTNFPKESVTYVEAPGKFNEEAFRTMDMAVALAGEYGVRLVIPLLNNWQWMGGRPNYAAFRGKQPDEFWTDPQLIADFKLTIDHVLNRVNTITGVAYKDDPTIMAWETGNELTNPPEWAIEIGKHIKGIDSKHLLISGYNAIHIETEKETADEWIPEYSIENPLFDMVNSHHYERDSIQTVANLKQQVAMVGGRKPIFIGEFGFISTSGIEQILDYVATEPAIAGALIWSLRYRHRGGGFYHHTEPLGYGVYRAYHWPGFAEGESYDETRLLALMRRKAFALDGRTPPPIEAPQPPHLLAFEKAPVFSWQGSTGAAGYDIERAPAASGPWAQVAYDVDDIETPGFALFSDETARVGDPACYRVIARNSGGTSAPSNVHCLDRVDHLTRIDRGRNLGVLHAVAGVELRRADYRSFKEAHARIHGETGGYVIYSAPGSLAALRAYAFDDDREPNIRVSVSTDGVTFAPAPVQVTPHASVEKNYKYLVPIRYTLDSGFPADERVYVKLEYMTPADIVRVEMDYRR